MLKTAVRRLPPVAKRDRQMHEMHEVLTERHRLREDVERLTATVEALSQELAELRRSAGRLEFVPGGHFYSAIPDLPEALARHEKLLQRDPTDIPGVALGLERQWQVLDELARLAPAIPFTDSPAPGLRYGFDNGAFAYGDGTMWHLMLRFLQPGRVVEIGSGHSSACLLDTADLFLENPCSILFVEPYDELLRSLMREEDFGRTEILAAPVQDVPLERFTELADGDVLFIDSTHVSKVGSDVNHLMFDVLPALQPGVVIHLHDIFPGFEYPRTWLEEGRAWQENYLLRAFLQYNSEFEILFWPRLLFLLAPEDVARRFPTFPPNKGGSIYLRRRGGSDLHNR